MKLKKESLLYDISNIAYVIADTGVADTSPSVHHKLHRVRDVCEAGNVDRVARILGLAYSRVLAILFPVLQSPSINLTRDASANPRDYEFVFSDDPIFAEALCDEKKLCIKETVHDYMVSMVLADWLAITLPEAADVWKYKSQESFQSLKEAVASIVTGAAYGFRRTLSPF